MPASERTLLLDNDVDAVTSDTDSPTSVPPTPTQLSRPELLGVFTAMFSAVFLGALDTTIVATLVSPIGSYFNASHQASYLGTSYLLSICCFTPLYGRLADILGRKGAMLVALALFGFGTLICGLANSMNTLIAARAIAGMGGGGIMIVSSVAMSDLVPLKQRGMAQGAGNVIFGLAAGLGGPLGGIINDSMGWRWAFFIQMPILAISFTTIVFRVNLPHPAKPTTLRQKLARIDWLGSLTLVTFVGCFLVAITLRTAEEVPWNSPKLWGFLITSAVSAIAFILVEAFVSAEPILPLRLLKQRTPMSVALSNFLISITGFSVIYNVPLYFSAVKLQTASEAGAHLFPNAIFASIGSLFAGWIMRATGRYWWLTIAGAASGLASALLMIGWNDKTSSFKLWFNIIPTGFGMAIVINSNLIAMIGSVSREDIAVATGISYLFRTTGQVLGVSMSGALAQSILRTQLRDRIHVPNADELIREIRHSTSIIRTLDPDLQEAAVGSWAIALRAVFIFNATFAFLSILACLPIQENELPSTINDSGKPVAPETPPENPDGTLD
ncbi:MFS general substrate transporter [Clavulina sp. PMI_390]|nr:MFS general substrate transporter [Clavulina sp. PMI_390]